MAAPTIVPASIFAKNGQPAPSDRVVVGSIGVGDLGRRHHLAGQLIPNKRIQMAAVCDVDRNHRDQAALDVFNRTGKKVDIYKDFRDLCDRQDIDAVLIAVPDHWHALTSIYAMESGKDVYCEKPLTLTIDEGKKMVEVGPPLRHGLSDRQPAAQRQAASAWRASWCATARSASCKPSTRTSATSTRGSLAAGRPRRRPNLDWNFWLGPAPYADYSPNRCHYQFRWFSDYSGGKMTDWGAHHNDIAQWGIGADGSGPVKVKGGTASSTRTARTTCPATFDVTYTYANGVELHLPRQGRERRQVHRQRWLDLCQPRQDRGLESRDILKTRISTDSDVRLYVSDDHHNNWLDCIHSRERPICDVEVGHRSVTVCHLGNIAIKLGRELNWDPVKEEFVGDEQAQRMCSKPMRAPWHL